MAKKSPRPASSAAQSILRKAPGDCAHPQCHKKASKDPKKLSDRCEDHQKLCRCWQAPFEKETGYCPACWQAMISNCDKFHVKLPATPPPPTRRIDELLYALESEYFEV